VLMVDSVRSDMLNTEVMPNTYEFSRSSQVFNQHWSTSNSTRFGLFGFFYGIPSTYWFDILKEQKGSVLFDILTDQGYQLHLDASAPLNSPEFDRTIFSAVRNSLKWGAKNSALETDIVIVNRLLHFLDQENDTNFFAFTFLDAPHGYKLPQGETPHFQPALSEVNYLALNNDFIAEPFLNLYKSSVYYNDRLLGKVFKKLADRDLLKNTVIIITSDHGPSHEDIIPTLLTEGLGCQNAISDYSTGISLFDENSFPQQRNLFFTNWNNKTIFTGKTYYNFTTYGTMEVLDKNYTKNDSQEVDHHVIQQQLLKMSQFLN
jgi:membrane-anchored protein YejM (alkaline phosphatase superfamily)